MDPKKVEAILLWEEPQSVKQLQMFLGFANFYRRFIHQFARIVKPLTRLLQKEQPWKWTITQQTAFDKLKKEFTSAPVLQHPNINKPFYIETDASAFARSGVLSQKDSEGKLHPCAFISKTLAQTEQNYDIHDREMLAIVAALKEWQVYIMSSPEIQVITDHEALKYFQTTKNLNHRQIRWSSFLSQFKLNITYRPGKESAKPDVLSRLPQLEKFKQAPPPQSFFTRDHTILTLSDLQIIEEIEKLEPITYIDGKIKVPDNEPIKHHILQSLS